MTGAPNSKWSTDCLTGQRHFGVLTSSKRKRVNELRQVHSLALRAGIPWRFGLKVALSS